jgi:hypothetical protein
MYQNQNKDESSDRGQGLPTRLIGVLLLLAVFFTGCDSLHYKVASENNYQDLPVFQGENIEVIESEQSNFGQLPLASKEDEFCFQEIEKRIKNKLSNLGFRGETEYFKFDNQGKFILRPSKEQVTKINLDSIKEMESFAGGVSDNNLYLIRSAQHEYLVMIGQALGASGIGVYYWNYLIVPLDLNKTVIKFGSVSSNPKSIKIDNSGTIYYTQVDQNYYPRPAADSDSELEHFPLIVSLFSYENGRNKKVEFKYNCRNWKPH